MYHVYILKSLKYPKTYTGITKNLDKRLKTHNSGGSGEYTQKYKPWKIIYLEICKDSIKARVREKYFKSSVGRRWIKKNLFSKI